MKVLEQPALSLSLKNVLLATDFSAGSDAALKLALVLASRQRAQVHTLHVAAPDCYQLLDPEAFAITFNSWAANASHPSEILRSLIDGLPSEVPLHPGRIWEVVSEIVQRNEIDLLVLASHGRHGIARLLLGSVAEDVFRNVTCPVLTVGPDVKPSDRSELRISKILLATDFEPDSFAPRYAQWLANEFRAELTVLHVIEDRPTPTALAQRLREVVPDDGSLWRKPAYMLSHGSPSGRILDTAWQLLPDVIILGARHPEPARINSHLPWDTAARVIAGAPCPVLTIRQGGRP
ncbi:MAG TPA: universal stress protein [Candidatus Angelobacter sp.]|nr:universal stress protein [Candidatus Angelobacter sp.]